jgi:hypothetical protein
MRAGHVSTQLMTATLQLATDLPMLQGLLK